MSYIQIFFNAVQRYLFSDFDNDTTSEDQSTDYECGSDMDTHQQTDSETEPDTEIIDLQRCISSDDTIDNYITSSMKKRTPYNICDNV